mmetsp:Transcript_30190/g.53096  ORF Transcript_30190/g.53096 Transcript_30190/m.53096 type:complete len:260 (+) Transcript_30190:1031-1810(+)
MSLCKTLGRFSSFVISWILSAAEPPGLIPADTLLPPDLTALSLLIEMPLRIVLMSLTSFSILDVMPFDISAMLPVRRLSSPLNPELAFSLMLLLKSLTTLSTLSNICPVACAAADSASFLLSTEATLFLSSSAIELRSPRSILLCADGGATLGVLERFVGVPKRESSVTDPATDSLSEPTESPPVHSPSSTPLSPPSESLSFSFAHSGLSTIMHSSSASTSPITSLPSSSQATGRCKYRLLLICFRAVPTVITWGTVSG